MMWQNKVTKTTIQTWTKVAKTTLLTTTTVDTVLETDSSKYLDKKIFGRTIWGDLDEIGL